ncbi:pin-formed 4 [Corchorus olitorius]|uniref:Pin-formed 4 n=1 Tax=Corchorus olitorius TaxID=93759 RepID=A0A1R3KVR4_9ROSI|nr:pin-formed 4 [Corchorus olitorius]
MDPALKGYFSSVNLDEGRRLSLGYQSGASASSRAVNADFEKEERSENNLKKSQLMRILLVFLWFTGFYHKKEVKPTVELNGGALYARRATQRLEHKVSKIRKIVSTHNSRRRCSTLKAVKCKDSLRESVFDPSKALVADFVSDHPVHWN